MSISKSILKIFGWKVENNLGDNLPKKAVIVVAPHTSLFDFPLGFIAYKAMGIDAHFLIKKEAFFFPLNLVLKKWGGIAVDRHNKNTIVEDVIVEFEKNDNFILTITPEATRSKVDKWKDGYYRIAKGANVPIIIGFMDYKSKTIGVKQEYKLLPRAIGGDSEFDTLQIQKFYIGMEGKHPEKFYLSPEVYK